MKCQIVWFISISCLLIISELTYRKNLKNLQYCTVYIVLLYCTVHVLYVKTYTVTVARVQYFVVCTVLIQEKYVPMYGNGQSFAIQVNKALSQSQTCMEHLFCKIVAKVASEKCGRSISHEWPHQSPDKLQHTGGATLTLWASLGRRYMWCPEGTTAPLWRLPFATVQTHVVRHATRHRVSSIVDHLTRSKLAYSVEAWARERHASARNDATRGLCPILVCRKELSK